MDPITQPAAPPPPPAGGPEHKPNWKKWILIILAVAILSSLATLIVATSQLNKQSIVQPTPTPLPAEVSTEEGDEIASKDGCVIGGCNSELCLDKELADEGVVSACVVRPEFACYKSTTCEKQANGTCGWTQTPQLQACLKNPSSLE